MGAYSRAYRVNLDEAMPEPGPYPSFDAFFTRRLDLLGRMVVPNDVYMSIKDKIVYRAS